MMEEETPYSFWPALKIIFRKLVNLFLLLKALIAIRKISTFDVEAGYCCCRVGMSIEDDFEKSKFFFDK